MPIANFVIEEVKTTRMGGQMIRCNFDGDSTYAAGGTPDFNAVLQAAVKAAAAAATDKNVRSVEEVECLAVVPQNCGTLVPSYDFAADKLFVYDNATDAENAVADISGTKFNCLCICQ